MSGVSGTIHGIARHPCPWDAGTEWRSGAWRRRLAGLMAAALVLLGAPLARAACLPIAGLAPPLVPAAFGPAQVRGLEAGQVRLTFLGHASFLIETPAGASAITDYNGINTGPYPPDVVTMNNAHTTHWTDAVEPGVQHVLRGWDPDGGMAVHGVTVKDLRVRNVPTNTRSFGGTRRNGNSIFVFETNGLCIAHLGHLHHTLTDEHLAELGLIDVLLVPVDGGYTLDHAGMVEVIRQINPAVVVPMHYFSLVNLERFLARLAPSWQVVRRESPELVLSRATLPWRQVLVLPGF